KLHPAAQATFITITMEDNMTKQKKNPDKKNPQKKEMSYLKQINPYVAGIDIGSRSHFVATPVSTATNDDLEICVREFSSFTPDLEDLANWLKECKVTSVAMESTGVYVRHRHVVSKPP